MMHWVTHSFPAKSQEIQKEALQESPRFDTLFYNEFYHSTGEAMNMNAPIAVFDSGVGGISVLRHLRRLMPGEDYLYFGDSANAPYGSRTTEDEIYACSGSVIIKSVSISGLTW